MLVDLSDNNEEKMDMNVKVEVVEVDPLCYCIKEMEQGRIHGYPSRVQVGRGCI